MNPSKIFDGSYKTGGLILPKVEIWRTETGPEGTFGKLSIKGVFECYTLERPAVGDHPCIPAGTYLVKWLDHPEHSWCYELQKVPGRTAILIHPANWFDQLLGCISLGRSIDNVEGVWKGIVRKMKGVTSSRDAVNGFNTAMEQKTFELTIHNATA